MSRVCPIWPLMAMQAWFAALLTTRGNTSTTLSGPLATIAQSSITPLAGTEAVTRTQTASLPAIERPSRTTPPDESQSAASPPMSASLASTPRVPTPAPPVLCFIANPTVTQKLGAVVHLAWKASGQRAELCPLIGTGPAGCEEVSLSGEQNVKTGA